MPLPRENAGVVRDIESLEGQQVACASDVLSAAVEWLKIESSD
jgi:hypothetical protein